MKRREFITLLGGAAATLPSALYAQPRKPAKIGVLVLGNPDPALFLQELQEGLRELGYVDGQNIAFEVRSAAGKAADLAPIAAELVALKADVIVAFQTSAATAAKKATKAIPIVIQAGDPIGTGLIASLARPGGNLTGVSGLAAELGAKNLELIREMLPSVQRVAVLANANDPFREPFIEHVQTAAKALKIETNPVMVRSADGLDAVIAHIVAWRAEAVLVQPALPQERVADLMLKHRLPAFAASSAFSASGGLVSYSPELQTMYRQVAAFVDKVLKGRQPADLPVEQPTKFQLVINLKTAKALCLEIPPTLLARADEVIE
jgi:putative ABC transport system substrate-binding protein